MTIIDILYITHGTLDTLCWTILQYSLPSSQREREISYPWAKMYSCEGLPWEYYSVLAKQAHQLLLFPLLHSYVICIQVDRKKQCMSFISIETRYISYITYITKGTRYKLTLRIILFSGWHIVLKLNFNLQWRFYHNNVPKKQVTAYSIENFNFI